MTSLSRARLFAVMVPTLLLGGALASQYIGHLVPCEMCVWQRWPHFVAILFALFAIAARSNPFVSRVACGFAALAILVSGGIAVAHAGVEYHWWHGFTTCAAPATHGGSAADILKAIMAAPIVRCDVPQWSLWGVTLAGWNALFSIGFGLSILWLIRKPR